LEQIEHARRLMLPRGNERFSIDYL